MQKLGGKAWNSTELETVRVSRNPYVNDLGSFVTVQLLEDTPPVLPLGNCARIMDILNSGPGVRNHILSKNGKRILCMQHRELRPNICPNLFKRIFEFEFGTAVTGLKVKGIYAEISTAKSETGPKVSLRRLRSLPVKRDDH